MTQMTMTGDGGGEGETYPIRGPPLAPPPAQLLERGNEKMYEIFYTFNGVKCMICDTGFP